MNRLPAAKRIQILSLLCEGASMRSVSRLADVSINTVSKLLVSAGNASGLPIIVVSGRNINRAFGRCRSACCRCRRVTSFSSVVIDAACSAKIVDAALATFIE